MDVLSVENLEVRYAGTVAVRGLSFTVRAGEVVALIGPNGAGKTSTMKAIEGLCKRAGGQVHVMGVDPALDPYRARACLGVQLQSTAFQPDLTVRDILWLFARLYGVSLSRREVDQRLEQAGLAECGSRRTGQLSGGQQQRLALQVALVHRPPLLLLDEPTAGLDPKSRRALWAQVEAQRPQGRSVLLTTHSMEEAAALSDRIAIIMEGRLVALDTPRALTARFASDPRVARVAHGSPTLDDVFVALADGGVTA
jgi:ABC-2 type transport system ATP-binding protein